MTPRNERSNFIYKEFSMGSPLSTQGRMSRAGYFWKGAAASALLYGGIILSMMLMPNMVESDSLPLSVWVMLGIFAVYDGVNTVKRLHDLNKPGWHYWLQYVPLYNIYLGIVLTFRAGTPSTNDYGENPLTGVPSASLEPSPARY